MVSPIFPYIEAFQLASGGIKEGASALFQAEAADGEAARQGKQYAGQVIAEAFAQIKAITRRYMALPSSGLPVQVSQHSLLAHSEFKAAVLTCADGLGTVEEFIGVPAERIAAALRLWVKDGDPSHAAIIAISCEAANKISKTKGVRAA